MKIAFLSPNHLGQRSTSNNVLKSFLGCLSNNIQSVHILSKNDPKVHSLHNIWISAQTTSELGKWPFAVCLISTKYLKPFLVRDSFKRQSCLSIFEIRQAPRGLISRLKKKNRISWNTGEKIKDRNTRLPCFKNFLQTLIPLVLNSDQAEQNFE